MKTKTILFAALCGLLITLVARAADRPSLRCKRTKQREKRGTNQGGGIIANATSEGHWTPQPPPRLGSTIGMGVTDPTMPEIEAGHVMFVLRPPALRIKKGSS